MHGRPGFFFSFIRSCPFIIHQVMHPCTDLMFCIGELVERGGGVLTSSQAAKVAACGGRFLAAAAITLRPNTSSLAAASSACSLSPAGPLTGRSAPSLYSSVRHCQGWQLHAGTSHTARSALIDTAQCPVCLGAAPESVDRLYLHRLYSDSCA